LDITGVLVSFTGAGVGGNAAQVALAPEREIASLDTYDDDQLLAGGTVWSGMAATPKWAGGCRESHA
jgi:hypothetical protein